MSTALSRRHSCLALIKYENIRDIFERLKSLVEARTDGCQEFEGVQINAVPDEIVMDAPKRSKFLNALRIRNFKSREDKKRSRLGLEGKVERRKRRRAEVLNATVWDQALFAAPELNEYVREWSPDPWEMVGTVRSKMNEERARLYSRMLTTSGMGVRWYIDRPAPLKFARSLDENQDQREHGLLKFESMTEDWLPRHQVLLPCFIGAAAMHMGYGGHGVFDGTHWLIEEHSRNPANEQTWDWLPLNHEQRPFGRAQQSVLEAADWAASMFAHAYQGPSPIQVDVWVQVYCQLQRVLFHCRKQSRRHYKQGVDPENFELCPKLYFYVDIGQLKDPNWNYATDTLDLKLGFGRWFWKSSPGSSGPRRSVNLSRIRDRAWKEHAAGHLARQEKQAAKTERRKKTYMAKKAAAATATDCEQKN